MAGLIQAVLRLGKWMNVVAGVTLVFMVFITVGDVILRSFRRPIPGTYELVALSGLILIGFSLPFTSWSRGHVFVDFLIQKMPQTGRKVINTLTRILAICFFAPAGWYLIRMGMKLHGSGEVTLTLQMPFYPLVYGVAACCFIQCLVMVCDIVKIMGEEYE
jgi:TRAP-type C4-dicarboxylate transport system permease small subunit